VADENRQPASASATGVKLFFDAFSKCFARRSARCEQLAYARGSRT
jgi:hypothetical protein